MAEQLAVLGCGPSGLFAAQAAVDLGWDVKIYSLKQKSRQYGAQWLHQPIPGITEGAGEEVNYYFLGDGEGYAEKVYGSPDAPNSFREFGDTQVAYDLRGTYDRAWDRLESHIVNVDLSDRGQLMDVLTGEDATLWVNTVPLNVICLHPTTHRFSFQGVWVTPRSMIPDSEVRGNVVYYNGLRDNSWYRTSRVFGHSTTEFPAHYGVEPPDVPGLFYVRKPLSTTCACHPSIRRVGRYGRWKKGVLSHEGYGMVEHMIYSWKDVRSAMY